MIFSYVFLALFAATLAHEHYSLEPEEMKAIQERLGKFELLDEVFRSVFLPEEQRGDCLAEGAACSATSGKNCCGIAMRCIIWDHTEGTRPGGGANWVSRCRRYKAGAAMEWVGEQFGG